MLLAFSNLELILALLGSACLRLLRPLLLPPCVGLGVDMFSLTEGCIFPKSIPGVIGVCGVGVPSIGDFEGVIGVISLSSSIGLVSRSFSLFGCFLGFVVFDLVINSESSNNIYFSLSFFA